MQSSGDPISIIEASYDLTGDVGAWLAGVVRGAQPLFEEEGGAGAIGFVVDVRRTTPGRPHLLGVRAEGVPEQMFAAFGAAAKLGAELESMTSIRACGSVSTLSQAMGNAFSRRGGFEESLRPFGAGDSAYVLAGDPLGVCCVLCSPYRSRYTMSARCVTIWQMVAAHIATAFRLRGRAQPNPDDGDAIVDTRGKVVHAVGAVAASANQRERLRQAAMDAFTARDRVRSPDALQALSLWQTLVLGRWSLVDKFDSDGRRFFIARRNEPGAPVQPTLSLRESQVAALAALAHPNKIIAYELGLSLSTVATILRRALRKLKLQTRTELIELFARSLP